MGFFDSAQEVFDNAQVVFDKGVSAAKGAVSGVAVEQQSFMRGFVRLCDDGWKQGWHERNGGNVTYRMTLEEVSSCRSFFYSTPSSWVALGVQAENLGGEFFAVSASGSHFRNVAADPDGNVGIVEISPSGDAWRVVWGFKGERLPTSEFASHILCHAVRKRVTQGQDRVLCHTHPSSLVACSLVLPPDAREVTRVLWKSMAESIIAFPEGVGVLPWTAPGGLDLARATSEQMENFPAVLWSQHGLMCSAPDFDAAFGLVQTMEKAAAIYALARSMNGGREPASVIPDDGLREIASTYHLPVNEAFLD